MLNHKGSHPEYFEELCALAASGQISEPELVELQDHMQHCAHCRSGTPILLIFFCKQAAACRPGLRVLPSWQVFSENSTYHERFLARALRKSGLVVSNGLLRDTPGNKLGSWLWARLGYSQVATLALALLLLTVGSLGYSLRKQRAPGPWRRIWQRWATNSVSKAVPDAAAAGYLSGAYHRAMRLQGRLEALPSMLETDAELVKAHRDHASAEARSKALEEKVQMVASELEALRTQHEEVNDSRYQLENKLADSEQTVTRVNDELQKTRQGRSQDATRIAALNTEIRQLSEKLGTQTETLGSQYDVIGCEPRTSILDGRAQSSYRRRMGRETAKARTDVIWPRFLYRGKVSDLLCV
jgi:hypothetical protein